MMMFPFPAEASLQSITSPGGPGIRWSWFLLHLRSTYTLLHTFTSARTFLQQLWLNFLLSLLPDSPIHLSSSFLTSALPASLLPCFSYLSSSTSVIYASDLISKLLSLSLSLPHLHLSSSTLYIYDSVAKHQL
jgi:hypothetical protein